MYSSLDPGGSGGGNGGGGLGGGGNGGGGNGGGDGGGGDGAACMMVVMPGTDTMLVN